MRKILLTSGGLTDHHKKLFWNNIKKQPHEAKIIFIPSAATESDGAREGISMMIYKLMEMGIAYNNIFVYHLKYLLSAGYDRTYSRGVSDLPRAFRLLTAEELNEYDAIFFCGGDARLLLDEINRTGFHEVLNTAVANGLFYVGMSAGSMVAAGNFDDGLYYISNPITVHCEKGITHSEIVPNEEIFLSDNQAIWISGNTIQIIE